MSNQRIVDMMEQVWQSLAEVGDTCNEDDWKTATDCPGWTVQDQVSHLVGSECRLLGRPAPQHLPSDTSHIRNEIGQSNEVLVDWRRSQTGAAVLAEFRNVTGERLVLLRAMTDEDFAAETQTPIGLGTMLDLIAIRVFDAWVHEQDIRRAVKRPGHLDGPVAQHAVGRCASAMPFVVGRKAQAPDGATVVFEVTGRAGCHVAVGMSGNRANRLEAVPELLDVRLTMDVETFACLGCGRWEPDAALNSGKVGIDGDQALGLAVVTNMNFMI